MSELVFHVIDTSSQLTMGISTTGAFVATFTYLAQDAPDYITGHAINLGAIGLSLLVTLGNIAYIRWESEYYTSSSTSRSFSVAMIDNLV